MLNKVGAQRSWPLSEDTGSEAQPSEDKGDKQLIYLLHQDSGVTYHTAPTLLAPPSHQKNSSSIPSQNSAKSDMNNNDNNNMSNNNGPRYA